MIIKIIDWKKRMIKELEVKSIRYEDDGIYYTYEISESCKTINKLSYNQFLGVKL